MILRIEHIGIAIESSEKQELFSKLLGIEAYKNEEVASEKVKTTFFNIGNSKIELLEATEKDSVIEKYISKRGEGIHHIAFEVDNIYQEIDRLEKQGFELLSKIPKRGADNKLICFLHPKTTSGVLVEICQEINSI